MTAATVPRLYTLGYQGRDLTEVLETVRSHGVQQVIDVRENAHSRKPGFEAAQLRRTLAGLGVAYTHMPELGCAPGARHALWGGESAVPFFEAYRRRLAERPQAVTALVRQARSMPTLLLCLERDPSRCHRAVLVQRLRADGLVCEDL